MSTMMSFNPVENIYTNDQTKEVITKIGGYLQFIWNEVDQYQNEEHPLEDKQKLEKFLTETKRLYSKYMNEILK